MDAKAVAVVGLAVFTLGAAVWLGVQTADDREPAPRFTARTIDGERFSNDTVKGKVVLVQFWTTWCGYCRRDQPAVETITREFKDKLIVLAVDVDETRSKVRQYLADSPRSCKIVLSEDTNLAGVFEANSFPLYIA
ncbi:MAG: TlpA family protein disulfide reductase, partial [Bryobacteraceae bacterium]